MRRFWPTTLLAVAQVAGTLLGPLVTGASAPARGDVSVLTLVAAPGYPALPHVVGSDVDEGTYDNPGGGV